MDAITVLGIDQAKSSGWCVVNGGYYLSSGVAKDAFARRDAVLLALDIACDGPLLVMFEDHSGFHFGRGNMSVKTILGMGAARGRWQECLERNGVKLVEYVCPKVWRRDVLGLKANVGAEQAKQAAVLWARATIGREVSHDEAEAIAIAFWADRNAMRYVKLPKRKPANDVQAVAEALKRGREDMRRARQRRLP